MKRYFIITYGCQMNKSDSERIAAKLEKQGYRLSEADSSTVALAKADLIVINVCSVRQSAINRVDGQIKKIRAICDKRRACRQTSPAIVLTGCILAQDKKKFASQVDEIWPQTDLNIEPKCLSKKTAYIPIMTGCNNFCTYCAVPYTRGQEKSRPAAEILKQTQKLISSGYNEIVLLGQNVNSYSSFVIVSPVKNRTKQSRSQQPTTGLPRRSAPRNDIIDFPNLLKMIANLPGNFKISFLTSHPKDMSDKLIEVIAKSKKISKEIHLPVQSGDTQILKKMNRKYTASHYLNLVKKIKKKIPDAQISTDIIVGFPTETKKQFQNTVALCKKVKFSKAYISLYSPRSSTLAAKMKDDISHIEKKRRWLILEKLINRK